jgi:hypothetical protein
MKMMAKTQPGQFSSSPARSALPLKPPFELIRGGVISAILTNSHFHFETLSICKQRMVERKGTASAKRWVFNGAEISASEVAPSTETDCKDFTYQDMLDGWVHYILILAELKYPAALIQDRLETYRWIAHGDWPSQNKCDFMHQFLLAHPKTDTMWMVAINTDCNLLINTHLNKCGTRPAPSFRREADTSSGRPPAKRARVKPNPRKQLQYPAGRPGTTSSAYTHTPAMKQAQAAALAQLQAAAPAGAAKLRICYACNDVKKACASTPCLFAHACIKCAGPHIRSACLQP